MSHQFESGVFTYGESAWHQLGVVVDGGLSAAEAFKIAQADFTVEAQPILHNDRETGFVKIVRTDKDRCLSVQSSTYKPLQNSNLIMVAEALREDAVISAVTVLDEGRKVNFTAKINNAAADVVPGDEVDAYIVGSTSHDGSLAFQVLFTPIRVVCNNTLTWALQDAKGKASKSIKIKHTKMAETFIQEIPSIMDIQRQKFTANVDHLKLLAKKRCGSRQFRDYVAAVFEDKVTGTIKENRKDPSTERPRTLEDFRGWSEIEGHFDCGLGMDIKGVKGTMWAAYNSVTQYLSHDAGRLLDEREGARARLESLYWGENARRNERALELALAACR